MTILVGQIASADGISLKHSYDLTPSGRGAEHRTAIYSCPAGEYRYEQPETIPVDVDHEGQPIGEVAFLAQRGLGLFAVLDVDLDQLPDPPWYLSAELIGMFNGTKYSDVTLHRVGIVQESATVGKPPAQLVVGDLDDAHLYWANGHHRPLLKEAADYARSRRYCRSSPHVIAPDRYATTTTTTTTAASASALPRGPLELRSAPTIDVTESRRTITVLAAPVDDEATVIVHGKVVSETFGRGCFAGDEHRTARIKVNREHNPERTVGKAVAIDPYSKLGCVAELRISRTPLGDETLALAEDRVLDCSVGFRIKPGGEQWNASRSSRTVTRGELDHVSLVPDPAYAGAGILDVRRYG